MSDTALVLLTMLSIPLGGLIAVYILWVLFRDYPNGKCPHKE